MDGSRFLGLSFVRLQEVPEGHPGYGSAEEYSISCLNSAFKFSGSSVRPAYPGFIVIKNPHVGIKNIVSPRKSKVPTYARYIKWVRQYNIIQYYKRNDFKRLVATFPRSIHNDTPVYFHHTPRTVLIKPKALVWILYWAQRVLCCETKWYYWTYIFISLTVMSFFGISQSPPEHPLSRLIVSRYLLHSNGMFERAMLLTKFYLIPLTL